MQHRYKPQTPLEDKRNVEIGRQAYRAGMPQAKNNYHQRAGWLQASLQDPKSFVNKTDTQLLRDNNERALRVAKAKKEELQIEKDRAARIARAKAKVKADNEKKKLANHGKPGRPRGSKDFKKRKKPKIVLKEEIEVEVELKAVQCNGCFNPFKPNRFQIKKSSYFCKSCLTRMMYGK